MTDKRMENNRLSIMFARRLAQVACAAPALLATPTVLQETAAKAADMERSGKQVVDAVCITCHGTGANGAPKIGDNKAWSKRASQGLTSLTDNALKGIRNMPAHGGNPGVTDLEISRAITYMVNQSGGHWVEPVSRSGLATQRTGEEIVKQQCVKCHETGKDGAPKIGDRDAWIPRMRNGTDYLVRSAINGHGGMPSRGGLANLTDEEIRRAILYMFNPGATAPGIRSSSKASGSAKP